MANNDLQNIDLNNPEFQDAWDVLQHTHRSVFLTGKAGTGKSTFLKYIRDTIKKKTVVLAPTGIAAVAQTGKLMDVFTISGQKVASKANASQLRSLKPGVYVINGQKVIVK